MATTSTFKRATISFTLPISCQICLGKVKQPVICPNQHVFCTPCLDVWLRHNQLCPTCRVPITPDSPCKQIRGGRELQEETVGDTQGAALRRARVDVIFDDYEREIRRLEDQIKQLVSEKKMHDTTIPCASSKGDKVEVLSPCGSEINSDEAISLLTMRLEASMMSSKRLERDVEKVKEANGKLRDENVALSMENGRLKQCLAAQSPRKFEKYAQTALQVKVDQCTKEVTQLKKALRKGDAYVEELQHQLRIYQERYGELNLATISIANHPKQNRFLTEKSVCTALSSTRFFKDEKRPPVKALVYTGNNTAEKEVFDRWEKEEEYEDGPLSDSTPFKRRQIMVVNSGIKSVKTDYNPNPQKLNHRLDQTPSISTLRTVDSARLSPPGDESDGMDKDDYGISTKLQSFLNKDEEGTEEINLQRGVLSQVCQSPSRLNTNSDENVGISIKDKNNGFNQGDH
ncbi:hypothetical protein BSL78_26024 [Apostichopus japonicus]|uniref:RING-type domain-containing protein n=1 Tax=Stichopus japonicus TaxID=307972 RepID=A0A2G8JN43_STIJA|nr:hypothetical protein BSL78_26024 [Apostichopus japonicus]